MAARGNVLPHSLPPRGLSRVESAAYVGVSPSLFDSMVKDGRMPPPKRINGRTVWDRKRLDAASMRSLMMATAAIHGMSLRLRCQREEVGETQA
jgi:predicted DNA-binding transcriptional regulator AlpA